MAMTEIDEAELVNYKNIAGAVQRMLANPESRRKILEAQKTVSPNSVIPELDAAKPLDDKIGAVTKKIEDIAESIAKDKQEREQEKKLAKFESEWQAGRSKAQKSGYTAEGLEALEKFMVEKGVADFDVAMAAFEKINPPAAPVSSSKSGFDILKQSITDTNEEMKRLMESQGKDNGAVNSLISKTLAEVRGR